MATKNQFVMVDGKWQWVKNCEVRDRVHHIPRDITAMLAMYLPFNERNTEHWNNNNLTGMQLSPKIKLFSGAVFNSLDGKRVIYEVGCDTIIYLLVNPASQKHYHYYLQPTEAFIWDVAPTGRQLAAQVSKKTKPIKTIVQYEMYFLMGMLSTVSIPALIAVIGSDITVTGIAGYGKAKAGKKLAEDLSNESKNLESSTPTLHKKLEEFVHAETSLNKDKLNRLKKQLPSTIVKDQKTQGMLAGALVGKMTVAPKSFTAWTAIITILTTATTKSVTKSPEAYGKVISNRYKPILDDLLQTGWDNPSEQAAAGKQLVHVFKEAGVEISPLEAVKIIEEVKSNPNEVRNSLINLDRSFRDFEKAINN